MHDADGEGLLSVNVGLRQALNLYAAVRPVRSLEGVETRYEDVDLVIVRENTEGLYSGIENEITEGVVTSLKVATEKACDPDRRVGVPLRERPRPQEGDGLPQGQHHEAQRRAVHPLRRARSTRSKFPEIDYEEVIIDAGCMRLVQDPSQFDVLLCENLYGDVVSDLCAGLVGGLGVTPGANIGDACAVFEAVHGSAPDIAGQGKANPLALLMSAVMMLNHLATTHGDDGCRRVGARIKAAYNKALAEGQKTRDIGGSLGTEEFATAVIDRVDE